MAGKKTTKNVKKNINKIDNISNDSLSGGFKIIIFVLLFLVGFYFLTVYLLNKKEPYVILNNANIQYTEILAGETFNQKDDDYYVLFFDKESDDAEEYNNLISEYKNSDSNRTIYIVDLSEGLNKKYIDSQEYNKNVTDISNLKIKGATLIHVVNGKVNDYVVDNISEYLNNN